LPEKNRKFPGEKRVVIAVCVCRRFYFSIRAAFLNISNSGSFYWFYYKAAVNNAYGSGSIILILILSNSGELKMKQV